MCCIERVMKAFFGQRSFDNERKLLEVAKLNWYSANIQLTFPHKLSRQSAVTPCRTLWSTTESCAVMLLGENEIQYQFLIKCMIVAMHK